MVIMAADDRKTNYRKTEKNFLKISFQDAKKMSEKKYSCLEEVKHHMNVSISPKYIGNIRSGLKEEMDKFLFSHQPKLQGVPLAYEKIIIEQSKIIDDQEFINIDICVKLIVFQPKISKVLCGFVNKIGARHYGCLFHNCINGLAHKPHLHHLAEEQKDYIKNIQVGDEIFIDIQKVETDFEILFVSGCISTQHKARRTSKSQLTTKFDHSIDEIKKELKEESANDTNKDLNEKYQNSSKKKKAKKSTHNEETLDANETNGFLNEHVKSSSGEHDISDATTTKKKKLKRKIKNEPELSEIEYSPTKKKKKKRKD